MHATPEQARILRGAVTAIKADPASFDMDSWTNSCGTTCCLAGHVVRNDMTAEEWAAIVAQEYAGALYPDDMDLPIRDEACRLLGLKNSMGDRLFGASDWPSQFVDRDPDDEYHVVVTPGQLEARVEHWIATGE